MVKRIITLELVVHGKEDEPMADTMDTVKAFIETLARDLRKDSKPVSANLVESLEVIDCEDFE